MEKEEEEERRGRNVSYLQGDCHTEQELKVLMTGDLGNKRRGEITLRKVATSNSLSYEKATDVKMKVAAIVRLPQLPEVTGVYMFVE